MENNHHFVQTIIRSRQSMVKSLWRSEDFESGDVVSSEITVRSVCANNDTISKNKYIEKWTIDI